MAIENPETRRNYREDFGENWVEWDCLQRDSESQNSSSNSYNPYPSISELMEMIRSEKTVVLPDSEPIKGRCKVLKGIQYKEVVSPEGGVVIEQFKRVRKLVFSERSGISEFDRKIIYFISNGLNAEEIIKLLKKPVSKNPGKVTLVRVAKYLTKKYDIEKPHNWTNLILDLCETGELELI